MNRRNFVESIALGSIVGIAFWREDLSALAPMAGDKLSRISISTWTFHNYFKSTREPEFKLPGEMLNCSTSRR